VEITCRRKAEFTTIYLNGRLAVSPGETELLALRSIVAGLVADRQVILAFQMAGLVSIDARGLGELVQIYQTLHAAGGELMLVAPPAAVRRMLAITRLDTIFPLFDSEFDAVRVACRTKALPNNERPARHRYAAPQSAASAL
jgi:anti-anti-sigma factor